MFSQFFHPEKIPAQTIEHAALLALEIFAVVTGNFPAALTVMAVHTLIFAYEQQQHPKLSVTTPEQDMENGANNHHSLHG